MNVGQRAGPVSRNRHTGRVGEVTDPERTLALLRSECEVCGAWGVFTGRTEQEAGFRPGDPPLTYAVVRCPDEGVDFTVWSRRGAEVLAAYGRASARAHPDLGVVRTLGERLAVRAAADDLLHPPPLGSDEVRVAGGRRPTVELVWTGAPVVSRADLDGLFGVGQSLPRTGPQAAHVLAYDVPAPGAPSTVVVFAGFATIPAPESLATRILWRVDLPQPT